MNILVTGANGFIGSNLIRYLIEKDDHVRGLILPGTTEKNIEGLEFERTYGDIRNKETIYNALDKVDLVYHLAARVGDWGDEKEFMNVNVMGTRNLLEASTQQKVRKFVHMSSLAVNNFYVKWNGEEREIPSENQMNSYTKSKVEAEKIVNYFNDMGYIESTVIRPGIFIFGPGDISVFPKLIKNLKRYWHVDAGRRKLCYSYVENLVDGIIKAGNSPISNGRTYLITDRKPISWKELICKISNSLNIETTQKQIPSCLAKFLAVVFENVYKIFHLKGEPLLTRYRIALVSNDLYFDSGKAMDELDYIPKISFDQGMSKTIKWYNHYLEGCKTSTIVNTAKRCLK